MKKLFFVVVATICLNLAYGQNKEVAVLKPKVIQGTISGNDILIISASMEKAFTKIEGYEAYTRTDQTLVAAEQAFQRSGHVDDSQIKAIGKQTGVAYICVFSLSKDKNELVVNSKIIDVVSGKIENSEFIVLYDITDRTNVTNKCQELAYSLLGENYTTKTRQHQQDNNAKLSTSSNSSNSVSSSDYVIINGVKWATKNVGAYKSEDYGNYYTWEQAKTACPSGWRLPTKEELESLNNAGSTWTAQNGINGRKFGDNNNFIFLPATGWRGYINGNLNDVGKDGDYWGSKEGIGISAAYHLSFGSDITKIILADKAFGNSVRCVKE